jgi:SagB-type dehydrogenase family enzyme
LTRKDELHLLVDVLSEYECSHLLGAVGRVVQGEPFWEEDIGLLYDQYVKLRRLNFRQGSGIGTKQTTPESAFVPIPVSPPSADGCDKIKLPPCLPLEGSLAGALTHRRSRRSYSGASISAVTLSTLLSYSCGVTDRTSAYRYNDFPLRSFPSHGGLQSPEVYLSVQAVEDLPSGLYRYRPLGHLLETCTAESYRRELTAAAFNEAAVDNAAVVLVITGCYERLQWKYGERSYRFMCIDSGFLAQNVYLVAEALGLGVCAISGFVQDSVEEMLRLEPRREIPLMLLTVGIRADRTSGPAAVT